MDALVRLHHVTKSFGSIRAVDGLNARIGAGLVTGLVGADGAGKSTLLRLMAGLLPPDSGQVDMDLPAGMVGYMPQRFGLYEDLSVAENLRLYAALRDLPKHLWAESFARLLGFSGLAGFGDRLAGKLSGGMKQKLGLACALVATPRLLLLDEPSVGVDPVSRRELWHMVHDLADQGVAVVWATAYLDEAERCHRVLLLDRGQVLHDGAPQDLTAPMEGRSFAIRGMHDRRAIQARASALPDVADALIQGASVRLVTKTGAPPPTPDQLGAPEARIAPVPPRFEDAFVTLLDRRPGHSPALPGLVHHPRPRSGKAVEAVDLTRRFGDFTAVDSISFSVAPGEIFGLLGPNGAGKSTTFRMLCGLMPPSSGKALAAGIDLARAAPQAKRRLGYMSQKFSLYPDLSVSQNLNFFAGVQGLAGSARRAACQSMIDVFGLTPMAKANAGSLPLGFKQRLALAAAILHGPDILFLDEPTSGVDPLIRREFWGHINALAADGVAVLVTTHFLDEAEYCDRIGIVQAGQMIAMDSPDALKAQTSTPDCPDPTLEDAFITLVDRWTHCHGKAGS